MTEGWAYTEGTPDDCGICGGSGKWVKRFGEGHGDLGTLSYSQNQGWAYHCDRNRGHNDWINWNSYKRLDKRGRELERNERADKQRDKRDAAKAAAQEEIKPSPFETRQML